MMGGLTLIVLLLLLWDSSREVILGALANADVFTLIVLFVIAWYVFQRN